MSITEFGADVKKDVPSHLDVPAEAKSLASAPAASHPVMKVASDHPAVKVAAASHPAVAALVASHPGVQAAAPHVSGAAAAHVDAQGGPSHPAVAANHPAVEKAVKTHPAVAAVVASHPHVVAHNPDLARRAAAHAEKHGWGPRDGHLFHHDPASPWYRGWGWEGGGFLGGVAASTWWPWHWGESRPGAPVRHHWWGRLRSWWSGEPYVVEDVYDIDPGLPSPEDQSAAYQAVDQAGDTGGLGPDDLDDSGSGEGGGAGTNSSISG
jgi:hypothetical protein